MFSHNEDELMAWGEKLGALLQKQDVLILTGDLGAGKTTFTKGLARGLGIKQMIKSPTYENMTGACRFIIWTFIALGKIQILLI